MLLVYGRMVKGSRCYRPCSNACPQARRSSTDRSRPCPAAWRSRFWPVCFEQGQCLFADICWRVVE